MLARRRRDVAIPRSEPSASDGLATLYSRGAQAAYIAVGLTIGHGPCLMHGVAPQMCGRVANPICWAEEPGVAPPAPFLRSQLSTQPSNTSGSPGAKPGPLGQYQLQHQFAARCTLLSGRPKT